MGFRLIVAYLQLIGLVGGGARQCVAFVVVVRDGNLGRWPVGGESMECE